MVFSNQQIPAQLGRSPWRRLSENRFEFRIMGIVAMHAEAIFFATVPVTGALSMHAGFPVAIDGSVALAAKTVGFFKAHQRSVGESEPVAVIGIVAVQTPALLPGMDEGFGDLLVHVEFSTHRIGVHIGMAVGAGKGVFGKRRRFDEVLGEISLVGSCGQNHRKGNKQDGSQKSHNGTFRSGYLIPFQLVERDKGKQTSLLKSRHFHHLDLFFVKSDSLRISGRTTLLFLG